METTESLFDYIDTRHCYIFSALLGPSTLIEEREWDNIIVEESQQAHQIRDFGTLSSDPPFYKELYGPSLSLWGCIKLQRTLEGCCYGG